MKPSLMLKITGHIFLRAMVGAVGVMLFYWSYWMADASMEIQKYYHSSGDALAGILTIAFSMWAFTTGIFCVFEAMGKRKTLTHAISTTIHTIKETYAGNFNTIKQSQSTGTTLPKKQ